MQQDRNLDRLLAPLIKLSLHKRGVIKQMDDITVNRIDPPKYGEEALLDWAERYMIVLGIPRNHSKKDLCYEHLFMDLFEYIKGGNVFNTSRPTD